ncbi:hypothetical protein ACJX0J_036999, partial [Zea mays]
LFHRSGYSCTKMTRFPNFSSFSFGQEQSFLKAGGGVYSTLKNKVAYCSLLLVPLYFLEPTYFHILGGQGSTKFFLTLLHKSTIFA